MNKLIKIYQLAQEWLRVHLGSRITPVFLVMLGLTFVLWYASKLQYTYTAKVPVYVSIGDERHRVECVVEGEPSSSLCDADVVIAVGVCRAVCAPRGRLLVLSRVSEPSEVLSVVEGGAAQLLALPVDPRRLRLKLLNIAPR